VPPTVYIIDGHAQFHRAYHAIRGGLSSPVTGEPTNMTFGFVGMILKLLKARRPDWLIMVIDAAGDTETFRSELDPQYKAQRDPLPQDFPPQIERCVSILGQMGIPVFAEPGVEADDVIATLVRTYRRERPELRIRIVSKDKDLAQLLDDHVEMYDPQTDATVTVEDLFARRGVTPEQVVDMLALMGDSSDNIPGVVGIGPKTAADLITTHGSIDGLLANLDGLTPKRRAAIEAARDRLPLNRRLVRLRDDLDLRPVLGESRIDDAWYARLPVTELISTFTDLGFNRHRDELRDLATAGGATVPAAPSKTPQARAQTADGSGAGTLFEVRSVDADGADAAGSGIGLSADTLRGDYRILRTEDELRAFVADAQGAEWLAVDTETDSLRPVSTKLCGISMSNRPGSAVYVPLRSPEPASHLAADVALPILRPLLEAQELSGPKLTGHNLKFDINVFRTAGLALRPPAFDSMIASYLVDATRSGHGLDALARGLLGHECTPIAAVIGSGRDERRFDQAPLSIAGPYAAEDADISLRLHDLLAPRLAEMGDEVVALMESCEMPLVVVLAALERNGIRVDRDELDRQRGVLLGQIDSLRRRILDSAPHAFNPDSPKQLAAVLFNRREDDPPGLGLKPIRRGKTGPSTDQETLERLASDPSIESPLPELIIEHRQLTKLVGTYLVALADAIEPSTGRVHASFHQTVAATGRLSSSDPNLQNIPIRSAAGRAIRKAFIADDGHLLLSADYSQIELRLLAHLSGDEALIEAFRGGADIHVAVAAEVFGVEPDKVTSEQRGAAKMVNFGIVYGITPFGLARRLGPGTPVERAKQIIEDYRRRFSGIDGFLAECIEHAKAHGFVKTILGRRRAIPQVMSRNPNERALGERMAINTVVQGSAADLIKVAMVDIHRRLAEAHPASRMLLQIHDELVFEVPEPDLDAVRALVVDRMTAAMTLDVPLLVETGAGKDWGSVK